MQLPPGQEQEKFHTVNAVVGSCLLKCFLAARSFHEEVIGQVNFTEEHYHASYELLVCHGDSGFQFVNGICHGYAGDSVFIFFPYAKHASISGLPENQARFSIRFDLSEKALPGYGPDKQLHAALRKQQEEGFFQFQADSVFLSLIDTVSDTVLGDAPYSDLLLSGLLSAIFAYALRAMCLAQNAQGGGSRDRQGEDLAERKFLIDYYFDHLVYRDEDERLKQEELCERLHLSTSQLNRVLKELYGTSFHKRKAEVRLAYIKYFLRNTDMSITDVARRTNFPSDSSFPLFFKQQCGMSPSEYRRRKRRPEQAAYRADV